MLQIVPGFTRIEKFLQQYALLFTLIVMYQGLFGGLSISKNPKILTKLSQNLSFKLFTLLCVAFSATKDIETSLLSVVVFIGLLHLLRSPEEREDVSLKNLI